MLGLAAGLVPPAMAVAQDSAGAATPAVGFTRVVPSLSYAPLTGLLVGGQFLRVQRVSADPSQRPSVIRASAFVTTKRQLRLATEADLWRRANRLRLFAGAEFAIFPSPFFGIGIGTTPEQEERFTPVTIGGQLGAQRQLRPGLFVAGLVRVRSYEITRYDSLGVLQDGTIPGSTGATIAPVELSVAWDTRDNVYSARRGVFARVAGAAAFDGVVASTAYRTWEVDARAYAAATATTVLALQLRVDGTGGAPPFTEYAQLGGTRLRGYVDGRYRDRHAVSGQVEVRQHVWGPIAVVGFGGVGTVLPDFDALSRIAWRGMGGGGVRVMLLPAERLALRVDVGVGASSRALTIGVGEAF